jgi:hypothetical protein
MHTVFWSQQGTDEIHKLINSAFRFSLFHTVLLVDIDSLSVVYFYRGLWMF